MTVYFTCMKLNERIYAYTASIETISSPMTPTSTHLPVITTSRSLFTETDADVTTNAKPSVGDLAGTSTLNANAIGGRLTSIRTTTCVSPGLYNQMNLILIKKSRLLTSCHTQSSYSNRVPILRAFINLSCRR